MRGISRSAFALACLIAPLTLGCGSVRLYVPGPDAEPLREGEGLLVVHVDSKIPIERLSFSSIVAVRDLPPGEHFLLLAVHAGTFRWTEIILPASDQGRVRFLWLLEDVTKFDVEAGRINYPGQLILWGTSGEGFVEVGDGFANRSALALIELRERYPGLEELFPLRYGGYMDDPFLDYFSSSVLPEARAQ